MVSMALTSFLTGVTEPIEFTFMFLAPWLYALHAVLTGAAMVTMDLLGVRLGFGFSAGLFDYALNFNKSTHPLYLIPVGAIYFALYYFVFRWCIVRFGLKTPGREGAAQVGPAPAVSGGSVEADAFILALGGAANLAAVDACATRLRLELANRESVDEAALKRLGVRGTVRVGAAGLQVVVGPVADLLAGEIRARLRSAPAAAPSADADGVLAGLGGRGNVKRVECAAGRLLVTVDDAARVDERALGALGARGVARASKESVHVLHPEATALGKRLEALLAG
jgi:PTS system N-acetylglucosamine-specific IIC component